MQVKPRKMIFYLNGQRTSLTSLKMCLVKLKRTFKKICLEQWAKRRGVINPRRLTCTKYNTAIYHNPNLIPTKNLRVTFIGTVAEVLSRRLPNSGAITSVANKLSTLNSKAMSLSGIGLKLSPPLSSI